VNQRIHQTSIDACEENNISGQNGTWLAQYEPPPQFEKPEEINAVPSRTRHVPVTTGGKTLRSTFGGQRETPTWYKEHTNTCNITPNPIQLSYHIRQ